MPRPSVSGAGVCAPRFFDSSMSFIHASPLEAPRPRLVKADERTGAARRGHMAVGRAPLESRKATPSISRIVVDLLGWRRSTSPMIPQSFGSRAHWGGSAPAHGTGDY